MEGPEQLASAANQQPDPPRDPPEPVQPVPMSTRRPWQAGAWFGSQATHPHPHRYISWPSFS